MSKRLKLTLGGGVAALLAAGALIAASQLGAGSDTPAAAKLDASSVQATKALLTGIPQQGAVLGAPTAPVTLVEYADIQCPYCGEWARNVFPQLVQDYVRTGKLRIVFRGLAFIGPDSFSALQTAVAAGQQGRQWQVLHLLFEHQGAENMGWADEALLQEIVQSAGVRDVPRVLNQRGSQGVNAKIQATARLASAAAINSTPSFELGSTGKRLQRLNVTSLAPETFTAAIDEALAK